MTAITSSGEDSIKKSLHVIPVLNLSDNYEAYFQVETCTKWIVDNNYERTALQFPDELLHLSVQVNNKISANIGNARVYILADSTYGSCCIDEKTAHHIQADSLIHFGHSCGSSKNAKLPVLYIPVQPDVSKEKVIKDFQSVYPQTHDTADAKSSSSTSSIGLLFDKEYEELATNLLNDLALLNYQNVILIDPTTLDFAISLPPKIFYLTSTERAVISKILQINKISSAINSSGGGDTSEAGSTCPEVTIYNPTSSTHIQTPSITKLLMKRNYYIEKVREAETVGILIGTLSVDNYIDVIHHLKKILKQAGKKSYVVSIGEINAPKLANFPDINVFVLVACPESTLIESKEFYQVVCTPWEVEIAFGRQNEHADYFVDYRVLLPGSKEHIPFEKYSSRNELLDVSLLNGVSRIGLNWQGLEELPAEENFKIHEGQSGIPACYTSEPQLS